MKPEQQLGVGNYALASHHIFEGGDIARRILFSPLVNAKEGQMIYLTDKTNIYVYKITSIQTVNPSQSEVMDDNPDGSAEVTLVTCTDAEASGRLIVKGVLTENVRYEGSPYQAHFETAYTRVELQE
ncbi:hypothetical protein GCM10011510_00750 [Streptococcus himalayensis]|uniref:Sortase n=2 Tax=Streptococcus himalayensis TaxID=1888195 RepID=A0A917A3R1_9STRE|nr:class A sortase [Streptococcus himalayensis]GGE23538.1 hypothetical protein GCM10011510_00750 [Streptococcus himalayensis]